MRVRVSHPIAIAFLALTVPAIGWAQGQGFPLEGLRITGNSTIGGPRIMDALGLSIGDRVTEADFNAARDRLLSTGAFQEVGFAFGPSASGNGYDAVFEVAELSPLYAYRFEEIPMEDTALRAALAEAEPLFDGRIPANPTVMNRFAATLRRIVASRTGEELEITGEVNNDLTGGIMILFRPAGQRPNISTVEFLGNQAVSIVDLRLAMNETAVGEPYSEGLLKRMLELSVVPLYEDLGHLTVSFPEIRTRPSETNRGIDVAVTIEEGPVYRLGEIDLEAAPGTSPIPSADKERMLAAGDWRTGEIADFTEIRQGIERLKQEFKNAGYLRVETPLERTIDDAEQVVDLKVVINPGERYSMGKLTIEGLDLLSEPVIEEMWQLQTGAPYSDAYPDDFVRRIFDEQIFDNLGRIGAEADIHDDTLTVDVTLRFEGARVAPQDPLQ